MAATHCCFLLWRPHSHREVLGPSAIPDSGNKSIEGLSTDMKTPHHPHREKATTTIMSVNDDKRSDNSTSVDAKNWAASLPALSATHSGKRGKNAWRMLQQLLVSKKCLECGDCQIAKGFRGQSGCGRTKLLRGQNNCQREKNAHRTWLLPESKNAWRA